MVATDRLTKERTAEVAIACERAGVRTMLAAGSGLPAADSGPALVVAGLAAGERRIPEELLAYVRARGPAGALLLICAERLVRPSLFLSAGRLAVLGADATIDTIATRLRILLTDQATAAGANDLGERAYPFWWSRDTRPGHTGSAQYLEDHGGFTQVFALEGSVDAPTPAFLHLRATLCEHSDRPEGLPPDREWESGINIGTIHYNPRHGTLLIFWPPIEHTLWMISPTRLPILSDLSRLGAGGARLRSSGGDVLLAVSKGASSVATSSWVKDLSARAPLGGPAVFDVVSDALKSAPDRWATVMELR